MHSRIKSGLDDYVECVLLGMTGLPLVLVSFHHLDTIPVQGILSRISTPISLSKY